jgi:phosphoglycolate phosphatase
MIRVVMFDFDGTIVDSARVVFNLFNGFANKYNYDQVPEEEASPYPLDLSRSIPGGSR